MRFDVLSRLEKAKPLVKEIKDIYLPELRDGSGTFFENYNATSGCHGANALVGAILMRDVLGLGAPSELEKKVVIRPNPGELNWARGAEKCSDGMIFMDCRADQEEHTLEISLSLPEGWSYELQVPFELENWKVEVLE